MAVTFESVLVERRGDAVCVTLNDPERRNPLTVRMIEEVVAALGSAVRDRARVAILTGAGRGFCAGGDIGIMSSGFYGPDDGSQGVRPWQARDGVLRYYRRCLEVAELDLVTIAAINGAAVGAGSNLAMACDIRLASADATLHASFLRIGLPPGMGAAWLLTSLVGPGRAAELILTGRAVDASEAERIGLVNRIVEPGALLDEAWAMAARIASGPPVALGMAKQALRLARTADHAAVLEFEAMAQGAATQTADLREGLEAFLQKRAPRFEGR